MGDNHHVAALDGGHVEWMLRLGELMQMPPVERCAGGYPDACHYKLTVVQLKPVATPAAVQRALDLPGGEKLREDHRVDAGGCE